MIKYYLKKTQQQQKQTHTPWLAVFFVKNWAHVIAHAHMASELFLMHTSQINRCTQSFLPTTFFQLDKISNWSFIKILLLPLKMWMIVFKQYYFTLKRFLLTFWPLRYGWDYILRPKCRQQRQEVVKWRFIWQTVLEGDMDEMMEAAVRPARRAEWSQCGGTQWNRWTEGRG